MKINGPVVPIPTPFTKDENVDYDSLSAYVKFLINNGIKNIMTTIGTSRFNLLSDEEIKRVNQIVAEECGKNVLSIVANPSHGSLSDTLKFAHHAEMIGADIFLVCFSDRFYGDDVLYNFYKTISEEVSIDILIHETPVKNGLGSGNIHYSFQLLDRLFELDNIIGLKEESLDSEYSRKIVKKYSYRKTIIGAGGGMSRYLRDYWLGSNAYLGGIANFLPNVELEFFDNMQHKNFEEAFSIVFSKEIPYFDTVVPMGWHPSLKEVLELKGLITSATERKPLTRISDKNRSILRDKIQEIGWI